ncbi:MAG: demethylmenaquinone methyltransferase / 2-methoxy-6-polyprenyl,4-benzoquinol methylase [Actinomycetota bacterium]|jgi:demethylmenaquinone methyltransferase/2-methoxy-6-polyprenyl-1,4-benzoquinol methylase|nr:demethylmenaquinone methyltransferase / 2-methoxy-6-polyprenyl,4-benzoquinol methylase [Actinomycetota bacterium]
MTRATLDKDPAAVAAMFDDVAPRYDLTNAVLSLGLDRTWRNAVRDALDLLPGEHVLDVATGTATSAAALARSGAQVVGCDFSFGMLRVGAQAGHPGVELVAGDALRLPFADASFDAVTVSFGLRNTADVDGALRELQRVTKPGGRLVVCEFSHPTWRPFRTVYVEYLMRAMPAVVSRVSSDPDAYVYLAESIRAWPDQAALAERISAAGWGAVQWRDLTGGIVALHRATKPS